MVKFVLVQRLESVTVENVYAMRKRDITAVLASATDFHV